VIPRLERHPDASVTLIVEVAPDVAEQIRRVIADSCRCGSYTETTNRRGIRFAIETSGVDAARTVRGVSTRLGENVHHLAAVIAPRD